MGFDCMFQIQFTTTRISGNKLAGIFKLPECEIKEYLQVINGCEEDHEASGGFMPIIILQRLQPIFNRGVAANCMQNIYSAD